MQADALRLLWLTEHYYPGNGGMAIACDRIVHALRRRGAWVDLVHLRRGSPAPEVAARENGRDWTVALASDPPHALAALWASLERSNAQWTHVVAFGGAWPLACAPQYAAWLELPLVTLLRGNDFDTGIHTPERRALLDGAIRSAAMVGCVTGDMQRRVERLHPQARVAWTPNGIDRREWRALPSDRRLASEWRAAQLGASAGSRRNIIGLFGDLKGKKGAEMLLEAIDRAAVAAALHLLVVGTPAGDFAARLPRGLSAGFLPSVPRNALIPLMLACDAVALPSLYEGFPNVLLEATALGIPLLASAAGAAGVADGRHGVLFRTGDPDDCVDALRHFLAADAAQRERWRLACGQLAAEFSVERECNACLALFAPAARDGAAPAARRAGIRSAS